MISETEVKANYESFKRLHEKHRIDNPNDAYWLGAVTAYEEVLEINKEQKT